MGLAYTNEIMLKHSQKGFMSDSEGGKLHYLNIVEVLGQCLLVTITKDRSVRDKDQNHQMTKPVHSWI